MKTAYTCILVFVLCLFSNRSSSQCTDCSLSNAGTNRTYSLTTGQKLCITSGTFTGSINTFPAGAVICVAPGAIFRPTNFNNPSGTVIIYGTAQFASPTFSANFTMENFGTVTANSISLGGSNILIRNNNNSIIQIGTNLTMNSASIINNSGDLYINGDMNLSTGEVINRPGAKMYVQNNFNCSGGSFTNSGYARVKSASNISGTNFNNQCSFVSDNGVSMSGSIQNTGYLVSLNSSAYIRLSGGTFQNGDQGVVQGAHFTNSSVVTGRGHFYFTGSTTNSNDFGLGGAINFYDQTPSASAASSLDPNRVFDAASGRVSSTTTKNPVAAVDTNFLMDRCVNNLKIIPVRLTDFTVLWNPANKALVTWTTADEKDMDYYVVEHSIDGNNFAPTVTTKPYNTGSPNHLYQVQVNLPAAPVHYFRLKMMDQDGTITFSPTKKLLEEKRTALFSIKANPVQSETALYLNHTGTEPTFIELLNTQGKVIMKKQVSASGAQVIPITNLDKVGAGIYFIRVSNRSGMQMEKLVVL